MTIELTQEVSSRLSSDRYGWLTTVAKSGQPVPRLVWFFFDGKEITVYSKPNAGKVRQITAPSRVNLDWIPKGRAAGPSWAVVRRGTMRSTPIRSRRSNTRPSTSTTRERGEVPHRIQHPVEDQHQQGLDDTDRGLTLVRACVFARRHALFCDDFAVPPARTCAVCRGSQRKSRLREPTVMVSLPIRSATTVTAPLAFCT